MLSLAAAFGGIGAVASGFASGETPNLTPGPFYPLKPLEQDADLTHIAGHSHRAQGELLHLTGRVLDDRNAPVAGARVEIWQADSHGRYNHPRDSNPAVPDADFQGYGLQVADVQGRYRFKTVKPAPYPLGDRMRTPHVHFQVTVGNERKVTQMFFPGEPLNETDSVLRGAGGERSLLFARLAPPGPDLEPDARLATFDIVWGSG